MSGTENSSGAATEVVIHPLVLLSVTDHYNREAKDTRKRVVGVLLGSRTKNRVDITNSFAVPFEEDLSNPNVWFLDHNFLESMFWMFKKVNSKHLAATPDHIYLYLSLSQYRGTAREEMMGFYSSGPKIKENDLKVSSTRFLSCKMTLCYSIRITMYYTNHQISALFKRFCASEPVFAIIDVRPGVVGIPTTAYEAVDQVEAEGKEIQRVFKHISCSIEADESEAVSEHRACNSR